jgi:hypothetical protein
LAAVVIVRQVPRQEGRHAQDLPDAAGEPLPRLGDSGDDCSGQGLRLARLGEQIIRPPLRATAGVADDPPQEHAHATAARRGG